MLAILPSNNTRNLYYRLPSLSTRTERDCLNEELGESTVHDEHTRVKA
jgi:hypothetical protein